MKQRICQVDICKSGDRHLIAVDQIVGDASIKTYICTTCASVIGACNNDVLVDHLTNRQLLNDYYNGDCQQTEDPFQDR